MPRSRYRVADVFKYFAIAFVSFFVLATVWLFVVVPDLPTEETIDPEFQLAALSREYNDLIYKHDRLTRLLEDVQSSARNFSGYHFFSDEKCTSPKLGLASMTRHNSLEAMQVWLDYHLFHLGVCHVFLRVQHSRYLQYLFRQEKYTNRISAIWLDDWPKCDSSNATGSTDRKCKTSKRDWQTTFVDKVMAVGMHYGLDWLIHIDDDELVYLHDGLSMPEFLKRVNDSVFNVHFQNTESIVRPPPSIPYPPFQDYVKYHGRRSQSQSHDDAHDSRVFPDPRDYVVHRFQNSLHYKTGKHAFGNGKSMGRLSPELTTNGVHFFRSRKCGFTGECAGEEYTAERSVAALLHYESPDFVEWAKKFSKYRVADLNHVVFGFYKQSIEAMVEARSFFESRSHVDRNDLAKVDDPSSSLIRVDIATGHDDSFYDLVPQKLTQFKGLDFLKDNMWDSVE